MCVCIVGEGVKALQRQIKKKLLTVKKTPLNETNAAIRTSELAWPR